MGKQQDWSVAACIFLFLSLTSQIHCSKRGNRLLGEDRPVSVPTGVNQQELKEKDLIESLPGQPPVSFKQYGGYVAINETTGRFFYYYFVESVKAKDPSTPVVLWFNGGPGTSSLLGAFTEHGPFRPHSDGKTLFQNPYSWNNEANMVYVETPAQVGFSYTGTPSDMDNPSDKATAEDNYVFLVKWLEKFPEYKGREVYLSGQSYAGHYAPQLAKIVLERNNQTFINLRGVLLGNPLLSKLDESKFRYEYLLSHGVISKEMMEEYEKTCDYLNRNTPECSDAAGVIEIQSMYLDGYNINGDKCSNPTLTSKPKEDTKITVYDSCSEHYLATYLNTPNVKEAMHASTTKLPYGWRLDNDELQHRWEKTNDRYESMLPILSELMAGGIRVWVYNGVLDSVVPVTWTRYLLKLMNLTVEKRWNVWFSEGRVAGYIEFYKGNFTYVSVRGAGHSVPADQPIRALTLFTSFIRQTPLPTE